jgi:DNA-binding CsgD family transcriptional regulator
MKKGHNVFLFPELTQDDIHNSGSNIKAYHYDKAIEEKLSGKNPLEVFECCIIDQSGKQYTCTELHCGESNSCLKDGSVSDNRDFHKLKYHLEDRIVWCNEVFPDIIQFIKSVNTNDYVNLRLVFNHRYIHQEGSVSQFMHEGYIFHSEETGIPSIKLKVFAEIGDFKTDETIILTIFRYLGEFGFQKVFRKVYGGNFISDLSQRELEIIRLSQKGYSNKMIAEKLNISLHTVKNHKRNSMEKTQTHNINELINQCLEKKWL